MMRGKPLGGLKQLPLSDVLRRLALAFKKPIRKKFQLHVPNPVVLKNALHLVETIFFEDVFEVGMPYAEPFEPRSGSGFHSIPKIEWAVLPVRVGKSP